MSRYVFSVAATITLHTEVEADSLEEAVDIVRERGPIDVFTNGQDDSSEYWDTPGEINADPCESPLLSVEKWDDDDCEDVVDAVKSMGLWP